MGSDYPTYDEVRTRVEQHYRRRRNLALHGAIYLVVNGVLWGLRMPYDYFPLFVTLGWLGLFMAHVVRFYTHEALDRAVEREWQRVSGVASNWPEKSKRGDRLALSDDGELVEISDDHWDEKQKTHGT
jgi:hypothetical protein